MESKLGRNKQRWKLRHFCQGGSGKAQCPEDIREILFPWDGSEGGVDEYVLIGEADDVSCGHLWETWRNPMFAPSDGSSSETPPFVNDGYRR
eukprot:scaffold15452_cov54-Cylindrotheca_fusiformis.AAC.2